MPRAGGIPKRPDNGHMPQGRRLIAGRYRLQELLGTGGMGTVWRAEDELLGREVALKEIRVPPQLAEDERERLHERTHREARSAARITHPNVVVVHDVVDGTADTADPSHVADGPSPCIIMEYVRSRTLADVLKEQGPLPPAEVARIGHQMTAALRAAHAAGVLHRDVKPGNVLLSADGRVVLTDFGIAMSSGASTLTRTGEIVGSVGYLAPERVRGRTQGPASDLWSLGATLFEAVEGHSPFRRDTAMETVYAIAADPLPPLTTRGPVAELVAELLRKEPDSRPSAAEAEQRLRAAAADGTTAATVQIPAPGAHTTGLPVPSQAEAAAVSDAPVRQAAPEERRPAAQRHTGSASLPPAGSDAGAATAAGTHTRRPALYAGLALLLAVAVAGGVLTYLRGQDGDSRSAPNASATGASLSPGRTQDRSPASSDSAGTPEGSQSDTASATPPDPRYEMAEPLGPGLAMPVPEGWRRGSEGGDALYIDPTDTVRLQIGVTDFEDVGPKVNLAQNEESSQAEGKLPGYERIRLDGVEHRGQAAAVWEFTFAGKERRFRAINFGFDTADGRHFALYLSAPADRWNDYVGIYETVRDGIDTGGGT